MSRKYPVISRDRRVQQLYVKVRRNLQRDAVKSGKSPDETADHRFASMLANQRFPGVKTETEFLGKRGTLDKQFDNDEMALNEAVTNARRHGYNPKPNDVYIPGLARFSGDPEAFCPPGDGRAHAKKICEKRGIKCDDLKVKGREPERDFIKEPLIPLGKDIVRREVRRLKKDPEFAKRSNRELVEHVIDKHANKL